MSIGERKRRIRVEGPAIMNNDAESSDNDGQAIDTLLESKRTSKEWQPNQMPGKLKIVLKGGREGFVLRGLPS